MSHKLKAMCSVNDNSQSYDIVATGLYNPTHNIALINASHIYSEINKVYVDTKSH